MIYLLTIYCVLFAILAWKRIDWAVAFVIFCLPTYLIRFSVFGLPMTLLEVMILLLFVVWLIKKVTNAANFYKYYKSVTLSNYKWWILIFLFFATVSVFVSPDRTVALGIWKAYFIEPILFFVVLINIPRLKSGVKLVSLITGALGASALVVAIPAIIQKFWPIGIENSFWAAEATRRVVSWYGFPNAVGLYLAPIVILFLGLIIVFFGKGRRDKSRLYSWVFVLSCFCVLVPLSAIIFARSEGALFGILAAVIFLGLFYPNKRLRLISLVSLVSLVLLVSFIPQARTYAVDKISLSDHSGQIRVQQWKETWTMLTDGREVFGAGLAGYQTTIEPYHAEGIWIEDKQDPEWLRKVLYNEEFKKQAWQPTEIYMYPHNIILNFWSEIGLFGMLVVLVLGMKFLMNYWKVKNRENQKIYLVLIAVMVAILVHGLVDVPYFKNDLSVFWWLLFAVGWLVSRSKTKIEFCKI
ncbi:hypothetical protein HN858_02880 [Candidatus Falkowbacteria bacterium]|jgi:O-antigen ligase|nr:hypothetical protein [Candidatus Falkowbacteria bacterium]MBT5503407.1 hypothetical protein [Candidatus Falkowbacteria bacterium]MBT6574030.1 hypothetical protein [Candidatus Falkowbacteria bacterium]MBT7348600.1 hypothetical protein [Candidatus Falkowbacteria bacterium]MBT7500390.1 hypothetical protein [Candidatus Falkowbacteria bacterium]